MIIVSRSAETLAAAKSAIAQKSNVRVDTVAADLSDSANVDQLAKDYPDIDILVNNAGAIPGGTLLDVDEATWRKAWDLKVFGYVNMCRAFYALMKARKARRDRQRGRQRGRHARSRIHLRRRRQCGARPRSRQSLGCVSAKDGIRVVALSPGPVETDRLVTLMKKKAKDRTGSEDNWQELLKPLPFGRGATPEEIGAAIAFLASPHSGYTSGSVVTIDAGLSARADSILNGASHAASDDRRRREALLRGDRQGHSDRLHPRVRRRLSLVGAAGALLRALLPLHHLQRARLSALGRAEGSARNIRRSARATTSARCSMR